jgi:two-component system cell cycle sensor histidine kinase/response regulator CckA
VRDTRVRVLLVDDDEDDYLITRGLVSQIRDNDYQLEWLDNYDAALAAILRREHGLCLLDYRLDGRTGLELLRETQSLPGRPPIILLTGQGDHAIDLEAMKAGAADYLVKGQLTADMLERAIRYAIAGKRAEETLRRERDLISRIMETSPVGIVVTDQTGKITFANRHAGEVLGLAGDGEEDSRNVLNWRPADLEGNPLSEPTPLKKVLTVGEPLLDVHHTIQGLHGRRAVLSTNATPLFNAERRIDGMIATVEDITERLTLEARLRQSQKMESVGQLAAGVAHDINNILTIIQGHAGLLLNAAPPNADSVKSLKQISAASERAAGFIRHLLMFSRKQIYQTKIMDLNAMLHNLEGMLPRMLGEHIALQIHCSPNLPCIAADNAMVEQIVINLAVNARDAMPRGGTLLIETSAADISAALARQNPEARAGRFVCLSVRDTGCGMDRQLVQRIFEPFFTTKEMGKGTGLGLSTVYGIVKQHQGWIEVESDPGVGSVFKVHLPAVSGPASAVPGASAPLSEQIHGGQETILVAEDEVNVLEILRNILQRYHYHVLIASSGVEALRVWEEHHGQIDLLLTDMIMPGGMTGSDLAAELKKRKPGLKVIYTSGYTAGLIERDFKPGDTSFLPKPYQPHIVAQLVRETLDAPAGQRASTPAPANRAPEASAALTPASHVITRPAGPSSVQETCTASSSTD